MFNKAFDKFPTFMHKACVDFLTYALFDMQWSIVIVKIFIGSNNIRKFMFA